MNGTTIPGSMVEVRKCHLFDQSDNQFLKMP